MSRLRFLIQLLQHSGKEFQEDNCARMAAGIAYYVLFSLFPLLILFVSILGLLLRDFSFQERVANLLIQYVPSKGEGAEDLLIREIRNVTQSGGKAFGLLGFLGLVWSGSNMFAAIRQALNIAFDVRSKRTFVRKKILDFSMILLTGILFLLSMLSTTVLESVEALTSYLSYFPETFHSLAWEIGSFGASIFVSLIAFFLIYRFLPARIIRWNDIWPGVITATILFEAGRMAFGFYLKNFGKYDVVFGSLGAIVSFLFWVYISSAILLFGGEVASEYMQLRKQSRSIA